MRQKSPKKLLIEPYATKLSGGRRLVYFPQRDGVVSIALDPARDAAAIRQMIALVAKRLHRGSTWMRAMEADLGVAPKYKGVARTVLPSYSFKTRRGP